MLHVFIAEKPIFDSTEKAKNMYTIQPRIQKEIDEIIITFNTPVTYRTDLNTLENYIKKELINYFEESLQLKASPLEVRIGVLKELKNKNIFQYF